MKETVLIGLVKSTAESIAISGNARHLFCVAWAAEIIRNIFMKWISWHYFLELLIITHIHTGYDSHTSHSELPTINLSCVLGMALENISIKEIHMKRWKRYPHQLCKGRPGSVLMFREESQMLKLLDPSWSFWISRPVLLPILHTVSLRGPFIVSF